MHEPQSQSNPIHHTPDMEIPPGSLLGYYQASLGACCALPRKVLFMDNKPFHTLLGHVGSHQIWHLNQIFSGDDLPAYVGVTIAPPPQTVFAWTKAQVSTHKGVRNQIVSLKKFWFNYKTPCKIKIMYRWDFPGCPVFKDCTSNAGVWVLSLLSPHSTQCGKKKSHLLAALKQDIMLNDI